MFMVTFRALLVATLVAVVCVAVLLAGHSARATVQQKAIAQTPPARFLLFTSQRSGSTWFCDVLARQPGVVCGAPNNNKRATLSVHVSELLIKYSFTRKNTSRVVTWKEFHGSLEHAFTLTAEALTQKGTEPKLAHGFKLMYDQVPDNLVEPFVAWLRENHVAVLHLVREALPLRISSMMQRMGEGSHSEDAQAAALSRQTHPLLDVGLDEILPKLITFKKLNERWTRQLRLVDGVPYLYVPYESLTGPDVLRYLQASIGLLASWSTSGSAVAVLARRAPATAQIILPRSVVPAVVRGDGCGALAGGKHGGVQNSRRPATRVVERAAARTRGSALHGCSGVAGIAPHDATLEVKVVQGATTSHV